eukprot:1120633-Pyramimonas_sp.AAC.1
MPKSSTRYFSALASEASFTCSEERCVKRELYEVPGGKLVDGLPPVPSQRCCRFSALSSGIAGNHWNRFGDIRRVRLSNPELRTLSADRTRCAKLFESVQRHQTRPLLACRGLNLVLELALPLGAGGKPSTLVTAGEL